jgi:NADH dehydrogenase
MRVLVLGGTGFLGRHVAAALASRGHRVSVGTRNARRAGSFALREAHYGKLLAKEAWQPVVRDADAVVNCVGILRPVSAATFERVHQAAPAALARACAERRIPLLHVSALGLHREARSRYILSKLHGEAALRAAGGDVTIVRPSLLDGDGGFGARWIRRMAQWPLHFVPRDATGRIAALHVEDAAAAIARLVEIPCTGLREADLGGADWRTFESHLAALRRSERPALVVRVPPAVARWASHVCDALHATPFSFGHLELLRRDNVPARDMLAQLIGRAPRRVGAVTSVRAGAFARGRASLPPSAGRDGGSTPIAPPP